MITYNIQLKNIEDFRKYANMNARFHIMGYLRIQEHLVNMYDILDIIDAGVVDEATLLLTQYRKEELSALREYLMTSGLLRNEPLSTDKIA